MSLAPTFSIRDDFPPVDYDQWRSLVEEDLQGAPFEKKLITHTYEGIDLEPLYTRKHFDAASNLAGFPGMTPFVRGSRPRGNTQTGLDLRQEYVHPDLKQTNDEILADLAGGVTSVLLRLATCLDADDGIFAFNVNDLDAALAGVQLDLIGVALDAGPAFTPAAALLASLWRRRGTPPAIAQGAFNADPLGLLAATGTFPYSAESALSQLAGLAKWSAEGYPQVTAVGVDTSPYHHSGATAAQDLACALATGVEYLRAMTAAGMTVDDAARQMLFRISLGTHHFLAIAKLRAARRLWSQVIASCGGSASAAAMRIHARTSDRVLTRRDPYVNLLRNTSGMFAACVGGAEVVTSVPFDHLSGLPSELSRRIARNTVLILEEEGHLRRVIDPSGGSWFLDKITDELARETWPIFQEIERRGGMLAALTNGWVAEQIDSAYSFRAKDIARRKEPITGVSEFPNVAEEGVPQASLDFSTLRAAATKRLQKVDGVKLENLSKVADVLAAAEKGATIEQIAKALGFSNASVTISPLEARGFAEPFEELRDASDAWQAQHERRPRVFLANMGPIAHHTARATYSKNFFEAGGFEVVTNAGFKDADAAAKAFAESAAHIAVICSSDKLYPELVPPAAQALKAAAARTVILAGNPGENEAAWRAAGVDRFIYIKCDVLATLRELLHEEGVLTP